MDNRKNKLFKYIFIISALCVIVLAVSIKIFHINFLILGIIMGVIAFVIMAILIVTAILKQKK
ncbi:MAG: hypothetical protein LBI03_00065 [Clostridiales bacterium]|jgi:hypothetical protein|nr:hypothetical protein [Clostridiales bacterium]